MAEFVICLPRKTITSRMNPQATTKKEKGDMEESVKCLPTILNRTKTERATIGTPLMEEFAKWSLALRLEARTTETMMKRTTFPTPLRRRSHLVSRSCGT